MDLMCRVDFEGILVEFRVRWVGFLENTVILAFHYVRYKQ